MINWKPHLWSIWYLPKLIQKKHLTANFINYRYLDNQPIRKEMLSQYNYQIIRYGKRTFLLEE